MTQREAAIQGKITREMELVAQEENLTPSQVMKSLVSGKACIPANNRKHLKNPKGIGEIFRVKINANLGTSPDLTDPELELLKTRTAIQAGADAIMDLSTGGDIRAIRKKIIEASSVPIGTVPIYESICQTIRSGEKLSQMKTKDLFETIKLHGEDGVDFITVHCGLTRSSLDRLKFQKRITGIVSRGGSFLAQWMIINQQENPLYENFDDLLDIAREYDMTLSLGDGLRPGCIADATDRAQIEELITLGELTSRAWAKGVQVMIEGPGHVPIHQIETNIRIQKNLCQGAPFYVLGPLVTDIAPGFDHITSAIGGALAGYFGADFLCYVTPAEHLRLPTLEDVRQGVIASKIAAHAADLARLNSDALQMDRAMAVARKNLDWNEQIKLSIDPETATNMRKSVPLSDDKVCSMCGKYCAIKGIDEVDLN